MWESNLRYAHSCEPLFRWAIRINTPLIAEGVETVDNCSIPSEEGCDEMQGFLFGEPVDIKTPALTGADAPTLRWWA